MNSLRLSRISLLALAGISIAGCSHFPSVATPTAGVFLEVETESGDPFEAGALPFIPERTVTDEGVVLLQEFEGTVKCRNDGAKHCPYNDASDFCTIGYGHLIAKAACENLRNVLAEQEFTAGISDDRATEILVGDLRIAQQGIEAQLVDDRIGETGITDFQYDALVSFAFNVGVNNFSSSTLLRELKARAALADNPEVAFQFSRWVNSNGRRLEGLVNRRKREVEHFFRGFEGNIGIESDSFLDESELIDIRIGEQ